MATSWPIRLAARERDERGYELLALADSPDRNGRVLLVQRNPEGAHALADERGRTTYGGVAAWAVTGGVLTIELDAEATAALGTERFELPLEPPVRAAAVAGHLRRLLA